MILNEQKGAALVGVMLVLLILTLLGSTAFLNSTTDLKISGHYHQSLQALYAAEAGLQHLLSVYRQNPLHFLQKKTGPEMNFSLAEPEEPNGPGTKFWINNLRYDPQETPAYVEVIMVGKDLIQNSLARVRATIFCNSSDVPAIFKTGIVTAGTLNLKGPLEISGSLHANRGYSVEPASVLEQLRSQQFLVTQSLDPTGPDFLPSQDIPLISEKGFQGYLELSPTTGQPGFPGAAEPDPYRRPERSFDFCGRRPDPYGERIVRGNLYSHGIDNHQWLCVSKSRWVPGYGFYCRPGYYHQ